mgnify:CR=1 FL=1
MRGIIIASTVAVAALASAILLAGTVTSMPPKNMPIGTGYYTALLNGYKLTPPVASDGFATIQLWIHRHGDTFEMPFSLSWYGLEGNITRAYLSFGEPWLGGQRILTLCEPCPTGTTSSYSRSAWNALKPEDLNYAGSFDNFTDFIKGLWNGRVWVVLETTAYPNGEVGGVLTRG